MERQLLNGLLAIAAVGADSGLLVINRFTLSCNAPGFLSSSPLLTSSDILAGTYKFPFPVTTTLIQNLISFIVIVLAERLTSLLLGCLAPNESTVSRNADQEHLLHEEEKPQPHRTQSLRRRSPLRRTAVHQRLRNVFWRITPVAIVYFAKIVLGNFFLTRLPLPTYTLVRIAAIPLSIVFNTALSGDSHSALTICCLTVATSSVVLAMLPLSDLNVVDLLQGASLSIADALFPILLLNAYDGRYQRRPSQDNLPSEDGKHPGISSILFDVQEGNSNFWSILRHVSFLSTVFLVAHVFVSGELQRIQENCYVLGVGILRQLLTAGGILNGTVLILMALLATAASPVTTTFLAAPMNAFQLAIFMYTGFNKYRWIGLSVCWALGLAFIFLAQGSASTPRATTRKSYSLARDIIVTVVLCGVLYSINGLERGSRASPGLEVPTCLNNSGVEINTPWPNVSNHTSVVHDDYLGTRPHVDTIANLTYLVEQCREVEDGGGVDDVINCLSILEHAEKEYLSIPKVPSIQTKNSDRTITAHRSLFRHDPDFAAGQTDPESLFGKCAGPVIPFHVYWTGSATWRVELFIKAYLYTQNLPCSRLWLWLDSDLDASAVDKMLCEDPIFQRFRPLVTHGDIVLKSWIFPDRVLLARESAEIVSTPDSRSSMDTEDGEIVLANGIVQDVDGQQWLNLKSSHASLAPVQVSDAVRFIVLHLHGGVYCDMDVLLLRDMRPLLLPDPTSGPRAFAEQWVERCGPYDYNTAVISVPANSSLSSHLLRGGVRMGMNFHPRVIGRMLWADGRGDEVKMLHNAVFDPLVTNLRREGTDMCTVPCHKNFKSAFMGEVEEKENEWSNYRGEVGLQEEEMVGNRSLGNFFRGAWAYHIHNQWWKFPEPTSWMDVITRAQDGYFDGSRTNAYGEWWEGPKLEGYDREDW